MDHLLFLIKNYIIHVESIFLYIYIDVECVQSDVAHWKLNINNIKIHKNKFHLSLFAKNVPHF